jgi:SAM-dependent methyltransferase
VSGIAGEAAFAGGREQWLGRQHLLRTHVRHELVARQLAVHLEAEPGTVLDVGAGQGTQAVRLARQGHRVVAVEPDPAMRAAFTRAAALEPPEVRDRLELVDGELGRLGLATDDAGRRQTYDVVACHGVLMYLADLGPAVVELADLVAPGGLLSLLFRNADALALRPGLRGDWDGVARALDDAAAPRPTYRNGLGVQAGADRLEQVASYVSGRRMHVEAWYGVRVLTDADDAREVPAEPELSRLLAAEERVGRTDPYRRVAPLVHLIGRRDAA